MLPHPSFLLVDFPILETLVHVFTCTCMYPNCAGRNTCTLYPKCWISVHISKYCVWNLLPDCFIHYAIGYCVNYPLLHCKLWSILFTKDLCILLLLPLSHKTSLHKVCKLVWDLWDQYMYSFTSTASLNHLHVSACNTLYFKIEGTIQLEKWGSSCLSPEYTYSGKGH